MLRRVTVRIVRKGYHLGLHFSDFRLNDTQPNPSESEHRIAFRQGADAVVALVFTHLKTLRQALDFLLVRVRIATSRTGEEFVERGVEQANGDLKCACSAVQCSEAQW